MPSGNPAEQNRIRQYRWMIRPNALRQWSHRIGLKCKDRRSTAKLQRASARRTNERQIPALVPAVSRVTIERVRPRRCVAEG
jgi:hypothetical protein